MLFNNAIALFREHMSNVNRAEETIKGYTIELNLLSRFLYQKYNGPVYLEEITLQDLEDYMQSLKERGIAPVSRNRDVYIIRSFYNFCYRNDYITNNLGIKLEAVSVPEKERVYLTPDEIAELISAIEEPLVRLIVNTLYYTGMRISECLNLRLEDVNFKESVITVRNTKNKKDRQIPVHDELSPMLYDYCKNWRKGKRNPYLFSVNNARKVSPDRVNRVLHKATQELKWNKHVTCHIIRHSFASNLVAKNINIVNIQKLLGHSNLSTTSIYTHTNMAELKNAVNSI
jgi:integrase/recombinase XerD